MDSRTCTSEISSDESAHPSRKFLCNYENCKAKFSKNSKLVIHIRTHTGERPFACDEPNCTKTFTNSSHLKRHKKTSHGANNEKIQCTAKDCNLWLGNAISLRRHIHRMHNSDRKYPFTCKECKEGFHKKRLLQKHTYIHTGELPFKCDICNEKFMTLSKCNMHKRTHTSYECECGNIFERWSALLQHRKNCAKKIFKCEECQKCFKNNGLLKYHMKTHVDKQDRETYKCDYEDCGRIYFYKRNLVYHINSFHKHIKNKIPCPHEGCDKLLSKKQNLNLHLKLHNVKNIMNKSRKPRKDKGVQKKCTAAKILGIDLPKQAHEKILAGEQVNLLSTICKEIVEFSSWNVLQTDSQIVDYLVPQNIEVGDKDKMEIATQIHIDLPKVVYETVKGEELINLVPSNHKKSKWSSQDELQTNSQILDLKLEMHKNVDQVHLIAGNNVIESVESLDKNVLQRDSEIDNMNPKQVHGNVNTVDQIHLVPGNNVIESVESLGQNILQRDSYIDNIDTKQLNENVNVVDQVYLVTGNASESVASFDQNVLQRNSQIDSTDSNQVYGNVNTVDQIKLVTGNNVIESVESFNRNVLQRDSPIDNMVSKQLHGKVNVMDQVQIILQL